MKKKTNFSLKVCIFTFDARSMRKPSGPPPKTYYYVKLI